MHKTSGAPVLAGSALVCVALGSIHAFSVFLAPLETTFGLGRSTVSLTYSLALVALTLAVLVGPKVYELTSAPKFLVGVGVLGALGALIAATAGGIAGVWTGYSLCFGIANGLGYGFTLQFAARANPARPGAAMGIVTAAYALGAAVSPVVFVRMLELGGFQAAMLGLSGTVMMSCLGAGWLVARAGADYAADRLSGPNNLPPGAVIIRYWIAYGAGVATGLMAIGHAAGFADVAGITPWLAPAVLAICNLLGSLVGGTLVDRYAPRVILTALPILSVVSLALLMFYPPLTLLALGLLGFAYGGTIAAYPAVIARQFPGDAGPRVYGPVFTAWGTAGLLGPWIAGVLYDRSQDYSSALWVAAVLAILSAAMAGRAAR